MKHTLLTTFLLLCAPWAAAELAPVAEGAEPGPAPRERVLRTWSETVALEGSSEGGFIEERHELCFDYQRGEATEKIYDSRDGRLIRSIALAGSPSPSREEIEEAFGIVHQDVELGALLRDLDASLDGGFTFEGPEGGRCGAGSRCLQVFAFDEEPLWYRFKAVVDLVTGLIVEREIPGGTP